MTTIDLKNKDRSAREVLVWSRSVVEPALHAAVDSLSLSMVRIVGYHTGWWNEYGQTEQTCGGKAIRPALALLSAQAVCGLPVAAVPAAVAVELVHNFSLLHDDVIDGDLTRRHRRTAWSGQQNDPRRGCGTGVGCGRARCQRASGRAGGNPNA